MRRSDVAPSAPLLNLRYSRIRGRRHLDSVADERPLSSTNICSASRVDHILAGGPRLAGPSARRPGAAPSPATPESRLTTARGRCPTTTMRQTARTISASPYRVSAAAWATVRANACAYPIEDRLAPGDSVHTACRRSCHIPPIPSRAFALRAATPGFPRRYRR